MNDVLRSAMAEAGQTIDSLAEQVGVDPKTTARWLSPGRIPHARHRAAAAAVLGRDVGDLWPDVVKRREPAWFRVWTEIEREAVAIRWFEPAWVPGLFQTESYARATLAGEMFTPEETDRLVAARLKRRAVLTQERPPLIITVIDEAVIRHLACTDHDMAREQLEHLAECAALSNVELHVLPATTGLHPGLGGAFTLAETRDGARVAHVDSQLSAQIVDGVSDVATLAGRWERIRSYALPAPSSSTLIKEATTSWLT